MKIKCEICGYKLNLSKKYFGNYICHKCDKVKHRITGELIDVSNKKPVELFDVLK